MKIGNIELRNGLALGPMAGVTDLPFRLLCKEQGCELLYTEMVSAKAILYKNKNTRELLQIADKSCDYSFVEEGLHEHPVGVQLFGSEPDIMAEQAKVVAEGPCDFIDVNMGCPVPKVVNNNEGSALMTNPKLVENILTKMVKAVDKPVTVKIRKGFTEDNVNAVEIAKIAEASGVSAIAVHGRTRMQYYSGKADWDIIKKVKEAVSIPVIGNGDVDSAKKALELKEYTGCDGIMIARAARGNPWIFKQVSEYLNNGRIIDKPSGDEVRQMILRHARMLIEYKGEFTGIREMRKHVAWYTGGLPHSAELRRCVNRIEDYDELEKLISQFASEI